MKKILGFGSLLALLLLSACASSGSNGSKTEVYGEVKSGYESNHH